MANKKKARVLSPSTLLTYLMVITFVLTGVSFARFGNIDDANDAATAAEFVITKGAATTFTESVYLKNDTDSPSTQHMANLAFSITSESEVPVTYDITLVAPAGALLPRGLEWYLTPVDTKANNYSTIVEAAQAGEPTSGTWTHRPDNVTSVSFTGLGIAPAGTHTQEYHLNVHFRTSDAAVINSSDYWSGGMLVQYIEGIKINVVARDARNNARPNNNNSTTIPNSTPYIPG